MRRPMIPMRRTTSRHDRRNPQRRARRPQLESLEGRIVQSILFGSYPNGTWAINTDNGNWRQISSQIPNVMTEGSSGTLYAGFNDGISRYDYGSNTWTHLAQNKAFAMSASRDNTLFVSEADNGGTFEYDGRSSTFDPHNWKTINTKSAIVLAAKMIAGSLQRRDMNPP